MIDIKHYNITQQELDDYISTITIPTYEIKIRPIKDYFELYLLFESGEEIHQGYYAYEDIDTSEVRSTFDINYIDDLCIEHFKDKLIVPIDPNANATKEDINYVQQRMTEIELLILGV